MFCKHVALIMPKLCFLLFWTYVFSPVWTVFLLFWIYRITFWKIENHVCFLRRRCFELCVQCFKTCGLNNTKTMFFNVFQQCFTLCVQCFKTSSRMVKNIRCGVNWLVYTMFTILCIPCYYILKTQYTLFKKRCILRNET